jgi:Peptidase C39 family
LENFPDSPWNGALQLNLGMLYYREGFFSRALDTLEKSHLGFGSEPHPHAKALRDRALGEYLILNSKLGRFEKMKNVFESLEARKFGGVATELISGSRAGLSTMHGEPEIAFRCGPMALDRIYASFNPKRPNREILLNAKSTNQGTHSWQNYQWAKQAGIPLRPAFRATDAPIPLPVLVHWKSGHFAALTQFKNGRYHLQDGTFDDAMWVTPEAIQDESSGYFLIPDDGAPLPNGWTTVDQSTAESIWGKG